MRRCAGRRSSGTARSQSPKDLFPIGGAKVTECRQRIVVDDLRGDAGVVHGQRMPTFLDHQLVDRGEQERRPLLRRRCRQHQFEQKLVVGNPDRQTLLQRRMPSTLGRAEQQKGLPERVQGHQRRFNLVDLGAEPIGLTSAIALLTWGTARAFHS